MALALSFKIEGETQLSRALLIDADRIKDWSPAFRQTSEYLMDVFSNQVFQTQGAVIDEHWSPLKKAYALQKAKKFPGKGLLEATGNMRNGFMTLWRPDMAQVWNKMEYFKYHQSNQPRNKLPRRVMIKLAETQREMIVKIFHSYFQQMISK